MMDVCAGAGAERLTGDWITADRILAEGMSARLDFCCLRPLQGVEVRLLVDGEFNAGIASVEISEELANPKSEFETQREIREILSLLRPCTIQGLDEARFGSAHDSGYILLDDFRGVDTAFSLGVEHDASWDSDVAKRRINVYQFDHTIDTSLTSNALNLREEEDFHGGWAR